jgi:HlyD family secretion protein
LTLQRIPLATVALGAVALVLAFFIGRDVFFPPTTSTAATITTSTAALGNVRSVVTGTGSLVPVTTMNVAFKTSGTVTEVDAKVGDKVTAGQILAKIDTTNAQVALDTANAQLATAQANLASTLNGTALTQAQHTLAQAQQSYNDTANSVAQTNQGDQNQLSSDQNQFNIDNAQLASDSGNYWYQQYQPTLTNYQTKLNIDQATFQTAGCNALSTSSTCTSDLTLIATDQQHIACLQQGGATCTTAEQQIAPAYKAVTADQGKVNGDNGKIAGDQTKLSLDQQSGQRSLNQAQNSITNAQDSLNNQASQRPATIQSQQAAVESATAAVTTAQNNLNGAVLTAPIDGVVTTVNGNVGDTASPSSSSSVSPTATSNNANAANSSSSSSSSAFMVLSNVSSFQIVAPFAEADASRVANGQTATVTFDAIQGLTEPAHVMLINPTATVTSNVVNYNATFGLDQTDPRLKAGMTSNLTVVVASASNVLTVPNSAITRIGTRSFVTVVDPSGKQVRTAVELGVAGDTSTEITSGISAGQKVLLPKLRASSTTAAGRGAGAGGGFGGGGGIRVGGGG